MATESVPPERDVKDFKFQQLCKIRMSPSSGDIKTDRLQWLATSSKFGLTFIAEKSGFRVIRTKDILLLDEQHAKDRSNHIIEDFPLWSTLELSAHVSHLVLSCDDLTLVVAIKECANLMLLTYDLRAFAQQNAKPLPFQKIRLNASPGASLLDLAWNPGNPFMLATCVSDGSVELFEIKENLHIVASLPVSTCATCLCWSPKGKQIVIGLKDGSLIQFDQELKAKKKWGCPDKLEGAQQVVDVAWLSTYMFLAAYVPASSQASDQPFVVLTSSSKDGKTEYFNYEDICYGSGENRKHKYYISFIQQWDLAVIASSNATETTIVGKNLDNKTDWDHWTLEDSGRAELPLADSDCDSFPVAMSIDFSSQMQVSLGDNKTHPPCPIVLLLSTDGLLVPFHMMYMRNDIESLTKPAEGLPSTGDRTPKGQPAQTVTTASITVKIGLPLPFGQNSPVPAAAVTSTAPSGLPLPFGQKPSVAVASTARTESPVAFGGKPIVPATTSGLSLFGKTMNQQPAQTSSNNENVPPTGLQTDVSAVQMRPLPSATNTAFGQSQGAAVTTASKFSLPTTGNSFQFVTKPASQTIQTPSATAGGALEFSLKSGQSVLSSRSADQSSSPVVSMGQSSVKTGFSFSTQPAATTVTQSSSGGVSLFHQASSQSGQAGSAASVGQGFKFASSLASGQNETSTVVTAPQAPVPQAPVPQAPVSLSYSGFQVPTPASPVPRSTDPSETVPSVVTAPQAPVSQAPVSLSYSGFQVPPASPVPRSTNPSETVPSASAQADVEDSEALRQRTQSANEDIEITFTNSIQEEMSDFMNELHAHKESVKSGRCYVGTPKEMQKLRQYTEEVSQFCNDVKDTTKNQSREVHDKKTLCMDMFAQAEECRVRQERNTDNKYHQLLRSRALDPASAEKLRDLQQQYQQLQQGLEEVDLVLDAQWNEYKNKKANKGRIQTPTRDAIYRVVKSNCNLIDGQTNCLDSLTEQLKQLKVYNRSAIWQNTNNSFSSKNSGPDLTLFVESPGEPRSSSTMNMSQSISISPEKQTQLREYLSRRAVSKVKSTVPANLSMSKIVAAQGIRDALAAAEEAKKNRGGLSAPTRLPSERPSQSSIKTLPTVQQALPFVQAPPTGQPAKPSSVGLVPPTVVKPAMPSFSTPTVPKQSGIFAPTALTGQAFFKKLSPSTLPAPPPSATTTVATVTSAVTTAAVSEFKTSKSPITVGFDSTDKKQLPPKSALSEVAPQRFGSSEVAPQHLASALSHTEPTKAPYFEDISPTNTPDSEDQEGFTGEEEYEDEEGEYDDEDDDDDDEDEDEAGFGQAYELSGSQLTLENEMKKSQPDDSNGEVSQNAPDTSEQVFSKPVASKNLFGESDSTSSSSSFQTNTQSFTFGGSGVTNKPLFGSLSTPNKAVPTTDQKSAFEVAAVKDLKSTKEESTKSGFSFSTTSASTTQPSSAGFSFKTASSSTTGFSFGGDVGIFSSTTSAKSEAPKSPTSPFSAFGGGSFGGTSPTTTAVTSSNANTESPAVSTPGSSFMTTASNKGVCQPTDTSRSVLTITGSSADTEVESGSSHLVSSTVDTTAAQVSASTTSPDPSKASILENLLAGTPKTTASGFGQPPVLSSLLGNTSTATTAQPSSSVFGGGDTAFGSPGPLSFAALSTSTSKSASQQTVTTSSSLFGSFAGDANTSTSVFGGAPTTTTASAFGGSATTTTTASVFGGVPATTTTTASIFGGAASTTTATSLFGGAPVTTTTASVFGAAAATTTAASIFGGAVTTTSTSSVFGGVPATTTTTGSVFGVGTSGSSIFGGSATTTASSIFGGTSATTSIFGGSTTPSMFGGNTSTTASPFGAPATFGNIGVSPSGSVFGTTASPVPSDGNAFGGGSMFGGLGGKPSAEKANTNVFGGNQPFGAPDKSQSSLFGKSTPSFGTQSPSPNAFGSGGSFTSGAGSVASSGFGIAPQQPAVSFGESSTFGGSPNFGTSSAFGSKTAFGNSPTFGGNAFGSAAFSNPVGSAFASAANASPQPSNFASFAGNTSPTFGALAQSSEVPTFGDMAHSSSPFGGGGGGAGFGAGSPAPAFGGQGFGTNSPQFTSYRG